MVVSHRRHQPFVLADDEPLVTILGQSRKDPGLGRTRVREEILDTRVFQGLQAWRPKHYTRRAWAP
jgi:hypothetical protein